MVGGRGKHTYLFMYVLKYISSLHILGLLAFGVMFLPTPYSQNNIKRNLVIEKDSTLVMVQGVKLVHSQHNLNKISTPTHLMDPDI